MATRTRKKRRTFRLRRNASISPLINPRRRRRRKSRRRIRINAASLSGWRLRKKSNRRRRNPKTQRYLFNPALTIRHGKNPRRKRRSYRRNPQRLTRSLSKAFSRQWLTHSMSIGGGIMSGMFLAPIANKMIPVTYERQLRPFIGVFHLILGSLITSFVKNRTLKNMGIVIAGTGVYDLVARNVTALGLPGLPTNNILIEKFLPSRSAAAVSSNYNVARAPVSRIASTPMASSYEAPGSKTAGFAGSYQSGSENPYEEVFN